MLFNSIEFLVFLPVVFILYWFVFKEKLKLQNLLVLVASYVFYGWWDYRFLALIFMSTLVDYTIGLQLVKSGITENRRKWLLWLSILFNLGVLCYFKYFNFFVDSWISLLESLGYQTTSHWTLNIILPVGISFYTFQTMSYTIDVYRGQLKPTRDFISFASFVSFFPQLVAGPIERATNLMPQILKPRSFDSKVAHQGFRLILWGLFKKVIVADNLAPTVDLVFGNYESLGAGTLWLGIIYFAFQIYCDFSGYSDIAIGTSKLFGFELMSNFKFPYFSRNIGEFWRRWHISLSTWFRDYLYIPLGGSKMGKWVSLRNIFIIFLVSGFWHGANWTFIFWGLIHALLYVPSFVFGTNRKYLTSVTAERRFLPTAKEFYQIISTFFFVMLAWVFFRSEDIGASFNYIGRMFSSFKEPTLFKSELFYYVLPLILLDWLLRKDERLGQIKTNNVSRLIEYALFTFLFYRIIFGDSIQQFIYFQF